ncbi:hexokinase-2 [Dermacentor silvarum]|uniref:hexokinase-2 n=1 Tax=Dermacentor silvarum TaxID=543639 RepID=UPI00189C3E13|nr:hexokinase-2 [Dermacentor silvarum]
MALEEALRRCYPVLEIEDDMKRQTVEDVVRPFVLDPDTVRKVRDTFRREMELGLLTNPERPSSLQMDVAHIPELPDGTETGDVLALDLGGTNFRVLHLHLTPGSPARCRVQHYAVPGAARTGPGEQLFDFLADCLRDFVEANGLAGQRLPLGFCFSFPIVQKALDAAVLTEWVVSYDCSGVVGEDVGRMLREAIRRRTDIEVDLVAIVNDTVGTLVQGAFMDCGCAIGLIMGTGSNGCYLEKTEKIQKIEAEPESRKRKDAPTEVIVNVEWGAFGDNGVLDFVKTELDRVVDDQSLFPGSFTFEKLLSGEFLGDIVRQILVELVRRRALFGGDETTVLELEKHGTFTAVDVSRFLEEDDTHARETVPRFMGSTEPIPEDDITLIRHVCGVVSVRAAVLVSVCLAELLERVDKPTPVTIAVDGSLYKYHPRLRGHLEELITTLVPERPFKLMLAENGSGKGAGLVAAVVERLRSTKKNGYRESR